MSKMIYVLNGPNLNLLGKRQPEIYGYETMADVEANMRKRAATLGLEITFFQSNHEGEIIDKIHEARDNAQGIIINPAAYTHTSVAILDALNALNHRLWKYTFPTFTSANRSVTTLTYPCVPKP